MFTKDRCFPVIDLIQLQSNIMQTIDGKIMLSVSKTVCKFAYWTTCKDSGTDVTYNVSAWEKHEGIGRLHVGQNITEISTELDVSKNIYSWLRKADECGNSI